MADSFSLSDVYDDAVERGEDPTAALETEFQSQEAPPEEGAVDAQETVEQPAEEGEEYFAADWFNNVQGALDAADPGFMPPAADVPAMPPGYNYMPPPQPPPPPPGYPPQPGQRPGRDPRYEEIDRLFEDPRRYVSEVMQGAIGQTANQFAGQTQREIARVMHANAQNALYNVKQSVDRAYSEHLNKDSSFRTNKEVRDIVNNTLQNMTMRAANAAYNGNYGPARVFDNPKLYKGLVAAARAIAGVGGVNPNPAVPAGGQTGRVMSKQADGRQRVQLPPDLEEVARSVNRPGFREELEQEYAESMRLGDISWR